MIDLKKILESELHTNPWPYLVVDNVLTPDSFNRIYKISRKLESIVKDLPRDSDGIWLNKLIQYNFDYSDIEFILNLNFQLLNNHEELLKKFPNAELSKRGYFSVPKLNYIGPNVNGTIHEEGKIKSLAFVLYVFPEKTYGTRLYSTNEKSSFVTEVEWKPNRAFIMCNQQDKTWHSFHSEENSRLTLNLYYEKMEYMSYINNLPLEKKIWFYEEFPKGKISKEFE
jgi:hypothetical protein